jgi:hypothetical protein
MNSLKTLPHFDASTTGRVTRETVTELILGGQADLLIGLATRGHGSTSSLTTTIFPPSMEPSHSLKRSADSAMRRTAGSSSSEWERDGFLG